MTNSTIKPISTLLNLDIETIQREGTIHETIAPPENSLMAKLGLPIEELVFSFYNWKLSTVFTVEVTDHVPEHPTKYIVDENPIAVAVGVDVIHTNIASYLTMPKSLCKTPDLAKTVIVNGTEHVVLKVTAKSVITSTVKFNTDDAVKELQDTFKNVVEASKHHIN